MQCYKGFDKNMECHGFRFEKGKTYEESEARLHSKGFHACENPFDCFDYYAPGTAVYHEVELEGVTDEKNGVDTTRVGTKITIGRELDVEEMIYEAYWYAKRHYIPATHPDNYTIYAQKRKIMEGGSLAELFERGNPVIEGHSQSTISAGTKSIVYVGKDSSVVCGPHSAVTADWYSAIIAGESSWVKADMESAIVGGSGSIITADAYSAVTARENSSVTVGDLSAVVGDAGTQMTGGKSSIMACRGDGRYKGGMWSVFVGYECNDRGVVTGAVTAVVDGVNIKENTWYKFADGKFVEENI